MMMEDSIWTEYRVSLNFVTKLCASVPADEGLIKKWLDSRRPKMRPPGGRSIDEINEEVLASLPLEEEQVNGLIFQRNNQNGSNLVVRTATLRAHMKDCADKISSFYVSRIQGERSFAVKVKHCVYHDEMQYWTPILRPDGSLIYEADGTMERPVHAFVKGIPVNSLKLFEFVEPARIDFKIKILGGVVKQKDLETLFTYGGTHGYAGERSNGEGRYSFKIEPIEQGKEKDDGNTETARAAKVGKRSDRGERKPIQQAS
jgi:hypothetical protein